MIPANLAAAVRTMSQEMSRAQADADAPGSTDGPGPGPVRPALLGLDFDGVLAPLVDRREDARPLPGAIDAVRALAAAPGLVVALVSGRGLADLSDVSEVRPGQGIALVGSHGAEIEASLRHASGGVLPAVRMTQEESALLARVVEALGEVIESLTDPGGGGSGLEIEVKVTGAVLHTRLAHAEVAADASARTLAGPGSWPGVHVTQGKSVVELAVVETSKGVALHSLQQTYDAARTLYVGDDVTDETAFAVLGPDDVGVKVGPGATHAAYRLDGPLDVLELLTLLVELVAQPG